MEFMLQKPAWRQPQFSRRSFGLCYKFALGLCWWWIRERPLSFFVPFAAGKPNTGHRLGGGGTNYFSIFIVGEFTRTLLSVILSAPFAYCLKPNYARQGRSLMGGGGGGERNPLVIYHYLFELVVCKRGLQGL